MVESEANWNFPLRGAAATQLRHPHAGEAARSSPFAREVGSLD